MKLDIIIPCYQAKETLFKTLSSIAIQTGTHNISVCLVNDNSTYDYSFFVEYFSRYYPIQELSLEKNVGPGGARNAGMKHTHNPYILFMDSDDYFYTCNALSLLTDPLYKKSYDLIVSNFLYERDRQKIIKKRNPVWLHGKLFKREFLERHQISFNETRANEDNGFNRLIILMKPEIHFVDETTYVYSENEKSITRKNNREYRFQGLEGYAYNMKWAMEEALKRDCDKKEITHLAMSVLIRMYFYYMELYNQYDVSKLLEWSRDIYDIYYRFPEEKTSEDIIEDIKKQYKMEYLELGTPLTESISFDTFLQKVGELHD